MLTIADRGGVSQKLTIADEGGRGVDQMLTIADGGGRGVQEPLILADVICERPLMFILMFICTKSKTSV